MLGMVDRKIGSSRRPARDDDDSDEDEAPRRPISKRDSASQRGLGKRPASGARRPVPRDEESDEDADSEEEVEEERPRRKGSGRGSARSAPPQRPAGNENLKKGFLYSTPAVMILLLALGWHVANLDDKKAPENVVIDFKPDVEKSRGMYRKAKDLYAD